MLALRIFRGDVNRLTLFERVRGIDDDAIVGGDATHNLERGAVVAANGDGAKLNFVVGSDHGEARAFLTEEHGVDGDGELVGVNFGIEMHFAEGTAEQAAVFVGNVYFGEQGAGRGIN